MKKQLIKVENKYIDDIGKTLHIERFDNETEFYCLRDKYGNVNTADTGKSLEEINERIEWWRSLVLRGVISVK